MDLATWNDLVIERAGIMEFCGGMPEPMARGKAWVDTVTRFGSQPIDGAELRQDAPRSFRKGVGHDI